jgi:hypothetical protein
MKQSVKLLQDAATMLHENGFSVIAVTSVDKRAVGSWKESQRVRKPPFIGSGHSIAIVCGEVSGNLECIDIDLKYSIDAESDWKKVKQLIKQSFSDYTKHVVIESTVSKGFHILYRCEGKVKGNQKIASRPLTEKEKANEEYFGGNSNGVKTIVETRGEGGYFVCAPSDGYTLMHGKFEEMGVITAEQRAALLGALAQMDTIPKPDKSTTPKHLGVSPFDDFNDRGNIMDVLEKEFFATSQRGDKIYLKRNGSTSDGAHGAEYDSNKKLLYVWTGNSVFESNKAYNHTQIYGILECNGNYSEAHRKLRELGFGDKWSDYSINSGEETFQEKVVNAYTNLATPDEIDAYLDMIREGRLQMGLPFHIARLDKHKLYKRGQFDQFLGHSNLGKSTVTWYLMVLLNKWYGLRGLIFSSENKEGQVTRSFIQFRFGKKITAMSNDEYEEAKIWFHSNFKMIRSEQLYTYKDILSIAKMLIREEPFDTLLIDPYNSLDVDYKDVHGNSDHQYHYRATTEMRIFCKTYDCTVFLNIHAVTAALRFKDKDGFPIAPQEGDAEGGGKFTNRADDFITVHRLKSHPTNWMVTELHVRKVKDTETGGRPTSYNDPVTISMRQDQCGFVDEYRNDPMTYEGINIFSK